MVYRSGTWGISDTRSQILSNRWIPDTPAGDLGCIFSWGSNECGQLGDGTVIPRSSPNSIPGTNWIYIASGEKHAAGIKADGTLWSWGENCVGQLGDGTQFPRSSPVQITGSWFSLAASGKHTSATKSDGTLWTWGLNLCGQLGDNNALGNFPRSSPVQVPGNNWSRITNSFNSTYAVNSTGCLFSWGGNEFGQLGDYTVQPRSSPVQICGSCWEKVCSGHCHALAIKCDNTLWVWGANYYGQLGISTSCIPMGGGSNVGGLPDRSSPIQIAGNWFSVAGGQQSSYATDQSGGIWSWGHNSVGQLAGSTGSGPNCGTINVASICTNGCWRNLVAAGANHVMALSCCNLLYTGGNNTCGQLGSVSLSESNGLTQRTSLNTWTSVSSSGDSSYAIKS